MSKQKKFFCVGRKWFDKVNGNTYCNAKVLDENGGVVFYIGFQYGYGMQYLYEAKKELKRTYKNFILIDLGCMYDKKRILKNNEF